MICYVGAAQNERIAQNAMKKYGKYTVPDPANPETEVVWAGTCAMLSGCKLISGYQNGKPVYHSLYWMNLLSETPDDALYDDVANIARTPIIEFDLARVPTAPVLPSKFVRRSANLPSTLVPLDTKLLGITPIWAGMPDMGWLYDSGA